MFKIITGSQRKAHSKTLMHVYKAMVRSRMGYGQAVYGNMSNTNIKTLQIKANAAIRLAQAVPS